MRGGSVRLCALMLIRRIVKHVYACMLAWVSLEWAVCVGLMRVGYSCRGWGLCGPCSLPQTTHPPYTTLAIPTDVQACGSGVCIRSSASASGTRSARYHLGIVAHNSSRAHKLACETASPS